MRAKSIKFELNEALTGPEVMERINKLVNFLEDLDDEAKVSAGDVLGYIMGWADIYASPEDEIEIFN
jgi:hypothetical protein